MKLSKLFEQCADFASIKDIDITGICDDSRKIKKGDMFAVIGRKNFDILSVIKKAESKAAVFLAEARHETKLKKIITKKPLIIVNDINREFERVTDIFYNFKKNNLKFIAITGTNGKTTSAYCIYNLLKSLGQNAALISTIEYRISTSAQKATHTTPDFLSLRKILKSVSDCGGGYVVMEVSSHAIDQGRIRGIPFSRCLFTNLSRDHLDYHKTIDNYFKTKRDFILNNKKALSLINFDDKYGKRIYVKLKNKLSYGLDPEADFRAQDIVLNRKGSNFSLRFKRKVYPVKVRLLGMHNISNIIGSIGLIFSLGFGIEKLLKIISDFKPVDGRLQELEKDIFVDYAHTPSGLKSTLETLKQVGYKSVICVFGCGGDRDRGKRPIMGKIASKGSYITFITSDNPRGENPQIICQQIAKGFKKDNYSIIIDRKAAIAKALKLLRKMKDLKVNGSNSTYCVLVAGKGHEDYQLVGKTRVPFKDKYVIRDILNRKIKV